MAAPLFAQSSDLPRCAVDIHFDQWRAEAYPDHARPDLPLGHRVRARLWTLSDREEITFEGAPRLGRPTALWLERQAARYFMTLIMPAPWVDFGEMGSKDGVEETRRIARVLAANPFNLEIVFPDGHKLSATDVSTDRIDVPGVYRQVFERHDTVRIRGWHDRDVFNFEAELDISGFEEAGERMDAQFKQHLASLQSARRCIEFDQSVRRLRP